MQFKRTRTARDLDNSERRWLEQESGKHLTDNEPVFVVYSLVSAKQKPLRGNDKP